MTRLTLMMLLTALVAGQAIAQSDNAAYCKKLGDYGFVPLLQALPADKSAIVGSGTSFTPHRTDFYVFTQQDPAAGTFAFAKAYKQSFSDDGGGTWYYTTALSSANNPNDIKV